jgi:hypothetical protein
MAKYLIVVESAYRATIEEQDDTALWFAHAMKNGGADVAILLRGDAVNYAVERQDSRGLSFGQRVVKGPDIARDVRAIVGKKIPVYVTSEDLSLRGIAHGDLIEGLEPVSKQATGALLDGFDRLFAF